jgi:hypothetical protein
MSSLSGQQINQTYQGLLKLATSSTGITSSFQSVEDGLGNNTGIKIKTNALVAPNLFGLQNVSIRKVGSGINNTLGQGYANDEYDSIVWTPFYDFGINSYSSITYQVSAVTSTSDVVKCAFYTSQFDDTYGFIPSELISTGATLVTNSTGLKVTTLSSTLSFSGYGPGIYWIGLLTTNVGSTPTVKFHTSRYQQQTQDFLRVLFGGFGDNSSINSYVNAGIQASGGSPVNNQSLAFWNGGVSVFESAFTGSTLTTYAPYTSNMPNFGFQLLANR